MKIQGETLRKWRTLKRLNQKGVAFKLNMSQQKYSVWEQKKFLSDKCLQKFLTVTSCTIDELITIQTTFEK